MSNSYYVETIERITEQQIAEEIIGDVNQIESDAITTINGLKDETVDYITSQKRGLILKLADTNTDECVGVRKILKDIDAETTNIYRGTEKQEGIVNIVPNTEKAIESNVRDMINNQFNIVYENNGDGNVIISFAKKQSN